jgi:hypothetical protein
MADDLNEMRPGVVALLTAARHRDRDTFTRLLVDYDDEGAQKIWALLNDLALNMLDLVAGDDAEKQRALAGQLDGEACKLIDQGAPAIYARCVVTLDHLEKMGAAVGTTLDDVLARLGLIAAEDDDE